MSTLPIGVRQFSGGVLKEYLALFIDSKSPVTVHVSAGESERVIHFSERAVSVLSAGERSGPGIAGQLRKRGKLDDAGLKEVLAEAEAGKQGQKESLIRRQLLTEEEYQELSRKLVRDEVFDLVFWDEALSRASSTPPREEAPPPGACLLTATVETDRLATEVKSWIEKWGQLKPILHGDHARLSLKEEGRKALAENLGSGPERSILEAVGGGTRLRALWREVDLEPADTCERLARLSEKGWVAVEPDFSGGDAKAVLASIDQIEKSLPRSIAKDLSCMKLVNLCRKAKLAEKACRYLQVLADEAAGRGDWEAACEGLRSLLAIKPDDAGALRQAVKLFLDQSREKQAAAFAFQVCQGLLRDRKGAELKAAVETLSGIPRADLLAREARADLSCLNGEKDLAAGEYQEISRLQESRGDLERAKESVGKAIGLVTANDELKKRFLHLKRASADPRRGRAPAPARGGKLLEALPEGHWLRKRPALVLGAAAAVVILTIFGAWMALGKKSMAETTPPRPVPAADRTPGAAKGPELPGTGRPPADAAPVADSPGEEVPGDGPPAQTGEAPAALSISVSDPFGSALEDLASKYGDGAPSSADQEPSRTSSPSSAGASAAAGEPPGERGAPAGGLCPRHGTHRLELRRLSPQRRIRFADSCDLTLENSETGEVLLDIEGSDGMRWSIGPHAGMVCAWKAGGRALIYRDLSQDSDSRTSWIIPPGTEALAVGRDMIALRQGPTTRLFTLDGIQIRAAKLPVWDEGLLTGSTLVISGLPQGAQAERRVWLVEVKTLRLMKPPSPPAGN
jgi:hypothetical protein